MYVFLAFTGTHFLGIKATEKEALELIADKKKWPNGYTQEVKINVPKKRQSIFCKTTGEFMTIQSLISELNEQQGYDLELVELEVK